MASAAEQMAANLSWQSFSKATDLKARIWYALGLLIVYRIGTFIPVPGIDGQALRSFFDANGAGLGDLLNMFTGGALQNAAIFSLGIMPYISASIIVQLLASMMPSLEQLKKEGEQGRRKINQYTRYLTLILALGQSFFIVMSMENQGLAADPGWMFRITGVATLVAGTMFLLWLGEQITARGIGNGVSLIIFVGIISSLPAAISQFFAAGQSGAISTPIMLFVLVMILAILAFVVFMERALRKVTINYPRRQVGNKVYGGESSNIPIKLNPSGVIPAIFATSVLILPLTLAARATAGGESSIFGTLMAYFGQGQPLYYILFAFLIIFFAYFYTLNVAFKPEDVAENLKKHGGFVPGFRPGARTAEYLEYVVTRILVAGSLYLTLVCVFPSFMQAEFSVPFALGGTSILIVVNVTMDLIQQIQSHLLAQQYEGLLEKSKLRGGGKNRAAARKRKKKARR